MSSRENEKEFLILGSQLTAGGTRGTVARQTRAALAAAAGVSVKMLFVHFHSKEDLVLGNEEEMLGQLLGIVRKRAPGQTPLEAVPCRRPASSPPS